MQSHFGANFAPLFFLFEQNAISQVFEIRAKKMSKKTLKHYDSKTGRLRSVWQEIYLLIRSRTTEKLKNATKADHES